MLSKAWTLWLVFGLCVTALAQMPPTDLLKLDVPAADHKLSYGAGPFQFGELRLPNTKAPHPVVMLVHGGCWMDRLPGRDPRITTYELLRPLAAALTRQGLATWNVEYRRAGNPGGGWPGTFLDLASATDFLRQIAPAYQLDLQHVILAGHSSGGQLALWIAARSKLPPSSSIYTKNPLRIKAVVNIDGPPDLAQAEPDEGKYCPVPGIVQFLGGTPQQQPDRYRQGSALSFLPLGIPQTIIAGELLQQSPDLVSAYQSQAKSKGDPVTVLTLQGSGHFDMLAPATPFGKKLLEAIAALQD